MSSPSRSGTFESSVDSRVEKFTESISFDSRLFEQDIDGSIAHARMLEKTGLIQGDECQSLVETLNRIRQEIREGSFVFRQNLEDIHMNIEQALIDRLGDVGRKLHTGRSRNDQTATDTRLWIRNRIDGLANQLTQLQTAFTRFAVREQQTVIPAYTHLQRAQPILAAHYALAFCEKFERDRERLLDCRKRVNRNSLGTAAVAGTSLPIDRNATTAGLGFDELVRNSVDSSSDRDYVIEFVFCLTLAALHLSNWAEDWIIWSTVEFDFLELPQEFCTGSSIMPQKINPDVLELIRGKSARVVGDLQTLIVLVKGLPLAYNRDLQEDKPALFDASDTVQSCLELATAMVDGSRLKRESIESGLENGFLDATTLMEHLILQGLPQRKAHHLVGQLVRLAMNRGCRLSDLSGEELRQHDPFLSESLRSVLGTRNAIEAFQSTGSTATGHVAGEIARWQKLLESR